MECYHISPFLICLVVCVQTPTKVCEEILTSRIDNTTVVSRFFDAEVPMATVTVTAKYEVVIPEEIREASGIIPGQKIQMVSHRNRIQLIPIEPMENLRGFLKGIYTILERDEDRL